MKTKMLKPFIFGVIAALISSVLVFLLLSITNKQDDFSALPGMPLASYDRFYPIDVDKHGGLYLDVNKFVQAVHYLLEHSDPKAAMDLFYLGQSNNINLLLDDNSKKEYATLIKHYRLTNDRTVDKDRDNLFHVYKDIVNGIGQTFAGTGIEIVLHDVRNPLRSVVALQNPISGRKSGDPNTNFGLELIKDYSIIQTQGASYISYELTLRDGRRIKSSTIPLYNDRYGLIGFICLNIDISQLSMGNADYVTRFLNKFTDVVANPKITELIENTHNHK